MGKQQTLLVMGGILVVVIIAWLFISPNAVRQADFSPPPVLFAGTAHTVKVDPHSDSPVGSLSIILIKEGVVAENIKVDPTYTELAKLTGGSVSITDPTKFKENELADHMFAVMSVDLSKGKEALFATGTVKTGGRLRLSVYMPNGNLYTGESKNNAGSAMFNIPAPAPGEWKAVVSGDGIYEIHATNVDDKDFYKVAFVEVGGRLGHQGLFPITRELTTGESATLRVVALSEITDLKAYYKLKSNNLYELAMIVDGSTDDEFYFKGNIPQRPFSLLLRWTDTKTQNKMEREFYPATSPQ